MLSFKQFIFEAHRVDITPFLSHIYDARRKGMGVRAIAQKIGVDHGTITRKADIDTSHPNYEPPLKVNDPRKRVNEIPLTDRQFKLAYEHRKNGLSDSLIAKKIKTGAETLTRKLDSKESRENYKNIHAEGNPSRPKKPRDKEFVKSVHLGIDKGHKDGELANIHGVKVQTISNIRFEKTKAERRKNSATE